MTRKSEHVREVIGRLNDMREVNRKWFVFTRRKQKPNESPTLRTQDHSLVIAKTL